MTAADNNRPVSISLLALPETTPAALYGLYEVLQSVGVAWGEITGETADCGRFDTRIVSVDGKPFTTTMGIPIAPHASIESTPRTDILVATDLSILPHRDPRGRWPALSAWIASQHDTGATLCSVCTGTVLLAEAGVLRDVEATTHWAATSMFETYYPEIRICPERILSRGGPDDRIVTSGGSASWEDLALYLIARFRGEAEAIRISKIFVFGDRSEGQLPYAAMRRSDRNDDAVVAEAQRWIAEHYAAAGPVARMVALSGLPERTFKRRFKTSTGYAPVDYVQTVRIEEAKQMLETSGEPTDAIAHAVGYEDAAFFRRLFKRKAGVTPARYRQRFRSLGRIPANR
ncbi:MAG: helix-turn-helix domain-containing protein [Bauldia sp.]|uniref:GlxA family transcriptional regulator n=1 Tax=Bauldia sp. TaxID=2575872 RepID=UPI001DA3131A|nr:helix-turn-helix domain-containing protein [Bauldia sp.]MCB1495784.1 helix-turn-helix domain-containing protein [Bauldia sp.]